MAFAHSGRASQLRGRITLTPARLSGVIIRPPSGGRDNGAATSEAEKLRQAIWQGGNHGRYIRSIGLPVIYVGRDYRRAGGLARLPNHAFDQRGRSALSQ